MTTKRDDERPEIEPGAKGVDSLEDADLEKVSGGVRGSSAVATKIQKVRTGGDGGEYIRPAIAGLMDPSGGG